MSASGQRPRTICVDLDGTLCTNTFGDYQAAAPQPWAIERVKTLARAGNRIVIFTARGTRTGVDWEPLTREQLEWWGVPYDELRFGKPSAEVYIDDRTITTLAWQCGDSETVPGYPPGREGEMPLQPPTHVSAVAEVGRTYGGQFIELDRHIERLVTRALAAGIVAPEPQAAREAAERVLATMPAGGDCVVTLSVGGGLAAGCLDAAALAPPGNVAAALRPLAHVAAGLNRFLASDPNSNNFALRATSGDGEGWPLLEASLGITCGHGGVVAGVVDGRLLTGAPGGDGGLDGRLMAELAAEVGIEVIEGALDTSALNAADEAMIAVTPFCVLALAEVDGRGFGACAPGPTVHAILERWSERVGLDVAAQLADQIVAARRLGTMTR